MASVVKARWLDGDGLRVEGSTAIPFFPQARPGAPRRRLASPEKTHGGGALSVVQGLQTPARHGHYWSPARSARDLEGMRNRTQYICSPATRTGRSRPRAGALTVASSYGYTGGSKREKLAHPGASETTRTKRKTLARGGSRQRGASEGKETMQRRRPSARGRNTVPRPKLQDRNWRG